MIAASMSQWEKRSEKKWTVAIAPALLKRYPRLGEVPLMLDDERQLRAGEGCKLVVRFLTEKFYAFAILLR
jgi:hypothetical protein